jgi:beta-lactamase class A/LysM repeat protein
MVLAVGAARQYTVKPGDTLGGISANLGVSQQLLIELNQLPDADHISAGQTLVLPEAGGPEREASEPAGGAPAPSRAEYTVRSGDSLSGIAATFGVSTASIVQANTLAEPDRLAVGQKLSIPGGRPAGASAEPSRAAPAAPAGAPAEVGSLLSEAAGAHKLDPPLVKALAWYLSFWRVDASSPTGAVGVMQITTGTQDWVAQSLLKRPLNRANPRDNVEIGVAYLAYLVGRFGDDRQGVAAYLQGPASVARGGVSPTTAKALDAIYGSRSRFAGGAAPPSAAAPAPQALVTTRRDLAGGISAAARAILPAARVGVAARNLATGERLDLRSGEVFPSASVNKLAIMLEVVRQFSSGKLARTASLSADLDRMITVSDNDAANRLVEVVGEQSINATLANLNLSSTVMRNPFSARGAQLEPGFNQTSPADSATLLSLLANDKLVSPAASQEMRALLVRAQDASKLVRGLPAGTRIAHKSGWYNGVANDAGIISAPRGAYVLTVFVDGTPDDETGNRLIAELSRLVYEAWGK